MSIDRLRTCCVALAVVAVGLSCPSGATAAGGEAAHTPVAQSDTAVDEDRAAALAREATGGKVLSVRYSEAAPGPAFLVKVLLQDGRVTVVTVDASTGALR